MKKNALLTEHTKQKFIEAFCTLYKKYPIQKITVQNIVTIAGYNRSTFYQYFSDIYDLKSYLEDSMIAYMQLAEMESMSLNKTSRIESLIKHLENKENILEALLGDHADTKFLERIKALHDIDLANTLSTDVALTPYYLEFHLSTFLSIYRLWLKREKDISIQQLASLVTTLSSSSADFHKAPYV